jgi:hypothetical protein
MAALSGVVLVALALHISLSWCASRQLERIVGEWRQDPGSPLPEMLAGARASMLRVPNPDNNAAWFYQEAIAELGTITHPAIDCTGLYPKGITWPLNELEVQLLREITAQDSRALTMVRVARKHPALDWGYPARNSGSRDGWAEFFDLAVRIDWAMMLNHSDGQLESAIENARDLQNLAFSSANYGPCLTSGHVAGTIDVLAAVRLCQLAWYPRSSDPEQEDSAWIAARASVKGTIAELLNSDRDIEIAVASWKGERVIIFDALSRTQNPPYSPIMAIEPIMYAPAVRADVARILNAVNRLVAAIEEEDISTALSIRSPEPSNGSFAHRISWFLPRIYGNEPDLRRRSIEHLNVWARRRLAAVIIAARLYYAEQHEWPSSLDQLVPTYLPYVPIDPFTGSALQFRTIGGVPVIYSAGEDCVDNGGSLAQSETTSLSMDYLSRGGLDPTPEGRRDLVLPLYLPSCKQCSPCADPWRWLEENAE